MFTEEYIALGAKRSLKGGHHFYRGAAPYGAQAAYDLSYRPTISHLPPLCAFVPFVSFVVNTPPHKEITQPSSTTPQKTHPSHADADTTDNTHPLYSSPPVR